MVVAGPDEFVIGTENLVKTAAFLSVFGAQPVPAPELDAETVRALYGLEGAREQLLMQIPGEQSFFRLVLANERTEPMRPYEAGPHGVDFYTQDARLTARIAAAANGALAASPLKWIVDGVTILEARNLSPFRDFAVYGVETERYSPSVLDEDPRRLHSHVIMSSLVIPADLRQAEIDFWVNELGFAVAWDLPLAADEMAHLQQNPYPSAMQSIHLSGPGDRVRVDLLTYPERDVFARDAWPMRNGLHALVLTTDGAEATRDAAPSAEYGPIVEGDLGRGAERRLTGVTPAGLRFELREPAVG